ncbi:mettl3 [Scenedesmus sp. PABB004]|nr:mettl3 [Scenedesmus sp. PABB004]
MEAQSGAPAALPGALRDANALLLRALAAGAAPPADDGALVEQIAAYRASIRGLAKALGGGGSGGGGGADDGAAAPDQDAGAAEAEAAAGAAAAGAGAPAAPAAAGGVAAAGAAAAAAAGFGGLGEEGVDYTVRRRPRGGSTAPAAAPRARPPPRPRPEPAAAAAAAAAAAQVADAEGLDPSEWQVPPHCVPIHANVTTFDWPRLAAAAAFDVILMDPPWQLATANPTRGVALGYSQLTDADIAALPVPDLQGAGFLFVWVINSKVKLTLDLFDKWGYTLVDEVVWVKMTVNRRLAKSHGYYLQHAKEVCLVGLKQPPPAGDERDDDRGEGGGAAACSPQAAQRARWRARGPLAGLARGGVCSDVIFSERRGQSQKPEEIYELIEALVPGGTYLEIFARKNNLRDFWVSVGNEVTGTGLPNEDMAALAGAGAVPGAVFGRGGGGGGGNRRPPPPDSAAAAARKPPRAMGSTMEDLMRRRLEEKQAAYDAQWDGGRGSHHPDYDPAAPGVKASRATEELYNAIVANDLAEARTTRVYAKIEAGADVNFVFGPAYACPEGYTPLMVAAHRGRLECAKALLRAGADPNYVNAGGDLLLFWAIDGGAGLIKLLARYGAQLDAASPKARACHAPRAPRRAPPAPAGWTPLSYAKARGKYGPTEEAGVYPEDVLLYHGATKYGSGPPALGTRSPRNSYDPAAPNFRRQRGTYQEVFEAP